MGYLSVNKDDFAGASAVSSYVTMILSLIGWLGGIVSGYSFGITIAMSLVSTGFLLASRKQ